MRNTIFATGTLAFLVLAGCASEKSFEVTGIVPPSEMREETRQVEQKTEVSRSKPVVAEVHAPRRDALPAPITPAERPVKQKVVTFPETPVTPTLPSKPVESVPAGTSSKVTITPDTALAGKVASVNASLHFVVLNFPVGRMAAVEQQMSLYRQGQKIGEVKITGPQQDDNIIADVVSGEPQAGDDVREK